MVFSVMASFVTSTSAASIELLSHNLENESYQARSQATPKVALKKKATQKASTKKVASKKVNGPKHQSTSNDLMGDTSSPDTRSYGAKTLQSLLVLCKSGFKMVKSGLKLVREHPGKALTIALALQNKESSIGMPRATALSVTNSYQNITSNSTVVPILPMTISGNNIPTTYGSTIFDSSNATFVLRDKNSGNITSCGLGWTFSNGVWNDYGDNNNVNPALSCLLVTRAIGYLNTIYIDSTFIDLAEPRINTAQGMIQINPSITNMPSTSVATQPSLATDTTTSISNMPSTTLTTQSPTPLNTATSLSESASSSLVNQSPPTINTETSISNTPSISLATQSSSIMSSAVPTPLPNFNQSSTAPVNSTGITATPTPNTAHSTTTAPSSSDTSAIPFISPTTSKNPYAIIGGAVGGGLALCSIIAGVVAFVRGWCGMHNQASSADEENQESGIQGSSDEVRSADYALIIVAQPQKPKESGYEDLPEDTIKPQFYESVNQPLT